MGEKAQAFERRVEPRADNWRSHSWDTGSFDTARRAYTPTVEGVIRTPQHLVMVTLNGGADRLEVVTACGHRYDGPDRTGAVSLVPAHCERRLAMRGVASEWGSIALEPALFEIDDRKFGGRLDWRPFSNVEDAFVAAMVAEFAHLSSAESKFDPLYCEAMSLALARHLVARYGDRSGQNCSQISKLPTWRIVRIADYVEANMAGLIRITDLATIAGLSPGYFHRAFKATTGQTPLEFVNGRRIRRAMELMTAKQAGVTEIALAVGFMSPSHFSRTFRRNTGMNPSAFRSHRAG